nr:hypothetical protein [Tanacetum cinerariifolium]
MAKKDMNLYHSRLTPEDLNNLIIKFKIPRDLHPRLPSEEFVMSKLSDDAIGIYHRIFDFSGVRIPFSSFLMALIKHYKVHFSQLGPLDLNKVITFEVLCQSLQIEPTLTLFRVFHTLCKQGDWFSYAKRRAPSPAISDAIVWRHPNAAIDDSRPAAGSFNMADVRRLSAQVINLWDMPEGVLVLFELIMGIHDFLCLPEWTGPEVQEEPYLDVRPTLQRLPFYCTPHAAADAIIPNPTPEDLAVGTPSFKILAKAEASQKRKASTSSAASSHVAKSSRSALAQSSSSTTRPSLFVGDDDESDDDDDDAYVEIPLVTPLCSAAVILPQGTRVGASFLLLLKALTPELNSLGKGIMVDDNGAPPGGVSRQRPSSGPAPSFRDVSGDAIHTDFFLFSAGPYYATYPENGDVFKDPAICKTIVDQFPTPGEMVRVKGLSDDQLTTKMSVLHYMMMSHDDELLALYRGLNQSSYEYVLSTDSWLKSYKEKVVGLTGLELQVSTLKKQVSGLNDKLATSDASFAKSKAKGKERTKKIKSLSKSLDNLDYGVACLSGLVRLASDEFSRVQGEFLSLVASAGFEHGLSMHLTKDELVDVLKKMISEYAGELLSVILQLELEKLVHPTNVSIPRDARVSPPIAKESTVTHVSKSLELSGNVVLSSSAVALEQNEEHVSVAVDGSDLEMTDGSERVSSGLTDVVVALSDSEKGDGSAPSSTVEEGILSHATRPKPDGFPLGPVV